MSDTLEDGADGEIPWKPPVIAAIVGSVLAAGFVIFALVTGPVEEPDADSLFLQPVPSADVPPGYTLLTSGGGVGVKVESVNRHGGSTTVVVSTAVEGATDPARFPRPDVAYWEIGATRVTMDAQFASEHSLGTTTIVFPGGDSAGETAIVAHPTAAVASESATMEVGPDAIGEPIAFGLGFEPGVAISGEIIVGDGWGVVEWSSPEGKVGTLDVVVTLVGTQNPAADVHEPIRLVPSYDATLGLPGTVITPAPLWGFGGSYLLHGDGRLLADAGQLSKIVIELEGAVVMETAEPVILVPPSDEE